MNAEPDDGDEAARPPGPARRGRIAALRRRARDSVATGQARLEAMRPRSWMVDTAFRAVKRNTDAAGGVLAAALAFRLFLLLLPYVLLVVLGVGVGEWVTSSSPDAVARRAGITGIAASVIADAAKLDGTARLVAFAVTLVAVVGAARALVRALATVHLVVWQMRVRRQSPTLLAVAAFLGGVTVVLLAVLLIGWLRDLSQWFGLIAAIGYGAAPAALWLLLARYLPHPPRVPWTAFVPGAALVAAAATALHVFTVYYITRQVAQKSDQYGAIGVALALLLWAYALGRIFIAAAILTAAAWFRDHPEDGGALVGAAQPVLAPSDASAVASRS